MPGRNQKGMARQLRLSESKVSRWKADGTWSTESLVQVLFSGPVTKTKSGRDWTQLNFENQEPRLVLNFPDLSELRSAATPAYRCALIAARKFRPGAGETPGLADEQILALLLMYRNREGDGPLGYGWAYPARTDAPDTLRLAALRGRVNLDVTLADWGAEAVGVFRVLERYFILFRL
jgi:hypothetical protein